VQISGPARLPVRKTVRAGECAGLPPSPLINITKAITKNSTSGARTVPRRWLFKEDREHRADCGASETADRIESTFCCLCLVPARWKEIDACEFSYCSKPCSPMRK
jgi:hypothetical protein